MNIIIFLYVLLMVDITATKHYSVSDYCKQRPRPDVDFDYSNSAHFNFHGNRESDPQICFLNFNFRDVWDKLVCVETSVFDDCRLTIQLSESRVSLHSSTDLTCHSALSSPWCCEGPIHVWFVPKFKDRNGKRGTVSLKIYTKEVPTPKPEITTRGIEYNSEDDSEYDIGLSFFSILGIVAASIGACVCCCSCCIYCCKDDDDENKPQDLNGQPTALTAQPVGGEHTSPGGIQYTERDGVQYTVYPMAGASGGSVTPPSGYQLPVQAVPVSGYQAPTQQSNIAGYQPVSQQLPYEAGPSADQLFPSSKDYPTDQYGKHPVDSTSASGEGYTMPSAPQYPDEPPPPYHPGM